MNTKNEILATPPNKNNNIILTFAGLAVFIEVTVGGAERLSITFSSFVGIARRTQWITCCNALYALHTMSQKYTSFFVVT